MTVTVSVWLIALVAVLAAALGFVLRDVLDVVRKSGRHAKTTPPVVLGSGQDDVIHLYWGDARDRPQWRRPPPPPKVVKEPAILP